MLNIVRWFQKSLGFCSSIIADQWFPLCFQNCTLALRSILIRFINIDFLSIMINIDHRWFSASINGGFNFYLSFYVSTLINIDQYWFHLIVFFFQICSTTSRSTRFLRHTVILLVPYATVYIGSWEQRFFDRILGNAHSLTIIIWKSSVSYERGYLS